jgi:hypothetical protein
LPRIGISRDIRDDLWILYEDARCYKLRPGCKIVPRYTQIEIPDFCAIAVTALSWITPGELRIEQTALLSRQTYLARINDANGEGA